MASFYNPKTGKIEPMEPLPDTSLVKAAKRVVAASEKVHIDIDTPNPEYVEWCAAVHDLGRLTTE